MADVESSSLTDAQNRSSLARRRWRQKLLIVKTARRFATNNRTTTNNVPPEPAPDEPLGLLAGGKHLLLGSRLNLLLCMVVFLPMTRGRDGLAFGVAAAVLLPLAALLGDATEKVAYHTNETVGGLLNATFGNATEVIVSVFALEKGLVRVVQVSLLGSVISNMLLVLGCAFIAAGTRRKVSRFNILAASANTNLLLVAVLALVIPATLKLSTNIDRDEQEIFSRLTSVVMLLCYALYVFFQLGSHSHLFDDHSAQEAPSSSSYQAIISSSDEEEEEEEEVAIGFKAAICLLSIFTVLIAVLSEIITGALEGASVAWGVPPAFVGFVLLPIVGNAAEHATAITMAYRNKVDLAIAVALGSSTQVALFCIPLMVILAAFMHQPLTLMFGPFETTVTLLSVIIVAAQAQSGESHWLNGVMLVACYFIISFAFLFVG